MFHILIVDPDPLVSMDIADGVRRFRAGIGVSEAQDLDAARKLLGAVQPVSHVFLRRPPFGKQTDILDFISETAGTGVTVVLVGDDKRPQDLPADTPLLFLGIPFTSAMLDALLWRMLPAARPA